MTSVTATYRLQFGGETTFDRAAELAPYFRKLGISHLYASPVFAAREGSTHGYDVTDYNTLNPALGGREGFERMAAALKAEGLGLILDIVPNHMAASPQNPWLADAMAKGQASEHAAAFDIDWDRADGKLVLPVLGAPLEEVLGRGELKLVDDDRFGRAIDYYGTRFPLAEGSETEDLAETLSRQHYALSFWRDLHRLNYRRFFDITDLIGVRMEDERVFDASHRLLKELIGEELIDGVRVDHVDGMRDPKGYLERLAALFPEADTPPVWVEKIVEGEERIPADWPVRGETGYAVMPWLDGVLTETGAERALTDLYAELTGETRSFHAVEVEAKREIIAGPFDHEFDLLAERLAGRLGRDAGAVRGVIEEIAVAFPIYRTYLRPGESHDAQRLRAFAGEAKGGKDDAYEAVLSVLSDPDMPEALNFQQMTGPVTAKAVEDTSFYRWHRWSALNEVGGDPAIFGRSPDAFHSRMQERAQRAPLALSATATHDTKRGEDVRARLAAASHVPDEWASWARDWWNASAAQREGVSGSDAYLLFQTIVGFWPVNGEDPRDGLADRLSAYMLKAAREAKRDTSWTDGDEAYEKRLDRLARAACEGELARRAETAAHALAGPAADLCVARAVLKAAIPGVPDTYQGTELTDLSLVDPDNRRPVDFERRKTLLARGGDGPAARKMAATAAMLRLRRDHPDVFLDGGYAPVEAGTGALAFTRGGNGKSISVAVAIAPGASLPEIPGESVLDDRAARVTLEA
ncbi:malto-oligosyltrehalose synthase [Parvularcula oceani]|uniref:malto-oligosyltrehalose synthase n=1 Tax=Parvularcula oceani TaxID=1247963 RepID=UPI00068A31BA|nr:malto-oligosyltrehalose synthase [Parvularcula oceani]